MRSLIFYLAGVNLEKSTKSHQETIELTSDVAGPHNAPINQRLNQIYSAPDIWSINGEAGARLRHDGRWKHASHSHHFGHLDGLPFAWRLLSPHTSRFCRTHFHATH